MALLSGPTEAQKITTIFIEVVANGFIVNEDYQVNPRESIRPNKQQVFNTKKQLFNYISKNL